MSLDGTIPLKDPLTYVTEIHSLPKARQVAQKWAQPGRQIPLDFELVGDVAILRKEGVRLILEPLPPKSLLALLATLKPIGETFPLIEDMPPERTG